MLLHLLKKRAIGVSLLALTLSGCFHPPFNNYQNDNRKVRHVATGAAIGAGGGAIVGSVAGNTGVGAIVGGLIGASVAYYKDNKTSLIKELQSQDIQFVAYGNTMTLIVPTDRYFVFNTPKLDDINYQGLNTIVTLLKYYPNSHIYVAGFTDNIGNRHHRNKLSQAQAETMLTFLWANGIPARKLQAAGYGKAHDIGDNHWIHGSAYNRRLEIQWTDRVIKKSSAPNRIAR